VIGAKKNPRKNHNHALRLEVRPVGAEDSKQVDDHAGCSCSGMIHCCVFKLTDMAATKIPAVGAICRHRAGVVW
jgi:hypothetical protein